MVVFQMFFVTLRSIIFLSFTPELTRDGPIGGYCKVTKQYLYKNQLVIYFLNSPNLSVTFCSGIF